MQISTAFMIFFSIFGFFFYFHHELWYYLPISPGSIMSYLIVPPCFFQGSLVHCLHLFLYQYLLPYTVFYLALLVSDFVIFVAKSVLILLMRS